MISQAHNLLLFKIHDTSNQIKYNFLHVILSMIVICFSLESKLCLSNQTPGFLSPYSKAYKAFHIPQIFHVVPYLLDFTHVVYSHSSAFVLNLYSKKTIVMFINMPYYTHILRVILAYFSIYIPGKSF